MIIKNIIWDWNGTLLDDAAICVDVMNHLLKKRRLKPLTLKRYREIFTFPVQDYYRALGFDLKKEDFEIPALEFMEGYRNRLHDMVLHRGAADLVLQLKHSGHQQFILSAMEHNLLWEMIEKHSLNLVFSKHAFGIEDDFARSKRDLAHKVFDTLSLNPYESLWIGDSLHDAEIAGELGCHGLLFSGGHQSSERLHRFAFPVINSLEKVPEFLNKQAKQTQ